MRILYLTTWFPYPLDNGSRIRVFHLVRALARCHSVSIASLEPGGWKPAQPDAMRDLCEDVVIVRQDPFRRSALHMALRFFSLRPAVAAPIPEMLEAVRSLHRRAPFDVVIASTLTMSAYIPAVCGNVATVLEEHNSLARWMYERYQHQQSPLQRLRCWLSWRKAVAYDKKHLPRFDLITMVSPQDATVTRQNLVKKRPPVMTVPNGVDTRSLLPEYCARKPETLIFNGSLVYKANFEAMQFFLEEIYPRIKLQRPDIRLRITGAHDSVDLTALSLDSSVTLTGFVDDVWSEVRDAAVAIVPLLSGGGTRLKVLEAMALGTPVVSTSKGAEGIDVSDAHHLLLRDTPSAFAEAVLHLLEQPNRARELAARARKRIVEKYDWREIGDLFAGAIDELVNARRVDAQ